MGFMFCDLHLSLKLTLRRGNISELIIKCLKLWNRVHIGIGKIQLVVITFFAGDNWLSADFLLLTSSCHQT